MKRIIWMLAVAAMAVAACSKPQYIIPIDDDEEDPVEQEGFKEKTWVIDVKDANSFSADYPIEDVTFPGEEICDFFDLTQEEFYKGMGGFPEGDSNTMSTSQTDNTIMFGIADKNNTNALKWIPMTSSNFGHWITAEGGITTWGSETDLAVFYTESICEWGLESPDEQTLKDQWVFTVGHYPGRTEPGKTYTVTEVYFYTDEDEVEYYAYVQINLHMQEVKEIKLNVKNTQEITHTHEFVPGYGATSIQEEINFDAVAAAIGISADEATVYAINSDGSVYPGAGTNFWFSVAGDVMGHGAGCGIDINKDAGTWTYCNYPDETLAGQTLKGSIAFVNPANNDAYVVKLTVNLSTIDYLVINQMVSYEDGESPYTLSENNLAAIAAALGVETFDPATIGTDVELKGVNADGSIYDGGFTANNGYWYTMDGNVANWGAIEAAGYAGAYLEYRGEGVFGCGLWGETGETASPKIALVQGDKTAVLTFNLTVDEPSVFTTEEVGTMEYTVSQAAADNYGGEVIVVDYAKVCELLELTDDDFLDKILVLGEGGTISYSGEAPGGFWYNADGTIGQWSGGYFYLNVKYGEALGDDASLGKLLIKTGCHPDQVKEAGSYTGKILLANKDTLKHVTVTVTINVTA